MTTKDSVEFRLLDTDLVSVLGMLPAAQMDLQLELNQPGMGIVKIPLKSRAANAVGSGMFARGTYRGGVRGGFFIENIGKDHANAGENEGQWMSISGRGALALLEEATVWDDGTTATTRRFTGTKAGTLITLITEAQARGGLANVTYDFSNTLDSDGNAWSDDESLTFNVNTTLLDVARQIAKTGIDFEMVPDGSGNFVLSAYKNGLGTDRSETVYFRVGVNCEEVSSLEAGGEIRNVLRIKYPGGFTVVKDDPSIAARRRREGMLDASYAGNSQVALTFAQAELAAKKDPKHQISVKVYDGAGPRAFVDYQMGDYIMLDIEGVEQKYRVRGMQLSWNGKKYADVVVDLNSIILENEIRMAQDIAWLRNAWETARDAGLIETEFWVSLSSHAMTINDLAFLGNKLYLAGYFSLPNAGASIVFGEYDLETGILQAAGNGLPALVCNSFAIHGTDIYLGANDFDAFSNPITELKKYDTLTGIYTTVGDALPGWINSVIIEGNKIYVGGSMSGAYLGGDPVNYVGLWDLDSPGWQNLGTALDDQVLALAWYNSDLVAAGEFTDHIKTYAGGSWTAIGGGLDGNIHALAVSGTSLYAGGEQTNYLSLWDGAAWTSITGLNGTVRDIVLFVGNVYVVGDFTAPGNRVAMYNGSWWAFTSGLNDIATAITLKNTDVYVGGFFTSAGGKAALGLAAFLTTFQSVAEYLDATGGNFDLAQAIHGATVGTLADADEMGFWKAAANALRKITWSNIKATLKTYFDTIYISLAQTANRLLFSNGSGAVGTEADLQYHTSGKQIWIGSDPLGGFTTGQGVHVAAEGDSTHVARHRLFHFGTQTSGPALATYAAGGTKVSPTHVTSGMILGEWDIGGTKNDGDQPVRAGYIRAIATADWTSTSTPYKLAFYIVPAGSTTATLALTINADGSLTDGVGDPIGGGSPGGSDTQIQFNDGGALAGFGEWDKAAETLGIPGDLAARFYSTGHLGSVTGTGQSPPPEYVVPVGSRVWIYDAGGGLSGDFVGHDTHIAYRVSSSVWQYHIPVEGETIYLESNNIIYAFNGSAWTPAYAGLLSHASSHQSGGGDPIKLDDLASPDDNTDLNASTTAHGLAPKAVAPAANVLNVLGIANGETIYAIKALFDATNPAGLGTAAPGTSLLAAHRDHVHASKLPPGYISTGTIANNTGDANNDIDFQARKCRDSTDAIDIVVAALTKRLDANWAVGTNQGGLDTGSKANSTWYHCYAIMRSDTGVTDFIFSASATSPTMPANYDYYAKLKGQSIKTDGSGNIVPFLDDGDTITWIGEVLDLNGGTATTGTLVTLSVPPGAKVEAIIDALSTTPAGGGALRVYDPDVGVTINLVAFRASIAGNLGARVDCKTNASAQVRYYVTTGGTGYIYTQGWRYGHLQR